MNRSTSSIAPTKNLGLSSGIEATIKRARKTLGQNNREKRPTISLDLHGGIKEAARARLDANQRAKLDAARKRELEDEVKSELRDKVKRQLKRELKEDVRNELRAGLRASVRSELESNMRSEVQKQLRDELREDVIDQLRESMRQQVYDQVKEEWRPKVIEDLRSELLHEAQATGDIEGPEGSEPLAAVEPTKGYSETYDDTVGVIDPALEASEDTPVSPDDETTAPRRTGPTPAPKIEVINASKPPSKKRRKSDTFEQEASARKRARTQEANIQQHARSAGSSPPGGEGYPFLNADCLYHLPDLVTYPNLPAEPHPFSAVRHALFPSDSASQATFHCRTNGTNAFTPITPPKQAAAPAASLHGFETGSQASDIGARDGGDSEGSYVSEEGGEEEDEEVESESDMGEYGCSPIEDFAPYKRRVIRGFFNDYDGNIYADENFRKLLGGKDHEDDEDEDEDEKGSAGFIPVANGPGKSQEDPIMLDDD